MAKPQKTPRKPGRPLKPVEEKLEQFSVRLPPATKIGLEVLAADSNLSLSQAVELAVVQLLATHKLSNDMTAEEVVTSIETQPLPVRLLNLYGLNPRFLEFQDRAIVETILASDEFSAARNEKDPAKKVRKNAEARKFVIENWRELSAALRGSWAKRIKQKRYSLQELIAPPTPPDDSDSDSLFFRKTA
jgi:hypothetical protein